MLCKQDFLANHNLPQHDVYTLLELGYSSCIPEHQMHLRVLVDLSDGCGDDVDWVSVALDGGDDANVFCIVAA